MLVDKFSTRYVNQLLEPLGPIEVVLICASIYLRSLHASA